MESKTKFVHVEDETQVMNLAHLETLTEYKRAVVVPDHPAWRKPKPAAVMINLPGATLLKLFRMGMFLYEKGKQP